MSELEKDIPIGTRALILSKHYYGALSKRLEDLDIDRYYSILYFLNTNDNCSQQHICNKLAIDKSAMVKVMDYLISKGSIQRTVNPSDRREHYINLTRKGKKQTARVVKAFRQLDKQMFAALRNKDKANFEKVMAAVTSNLEALPGNDLFFNYRRTGKLSKRNKDKE